MRQWSADRALGALVSLRGWRAARWLAVAVVVALRVALGGVMGAVWLVVSPYLPPIMTHVDVVLTGGQRYGRLGEAALGVWARWDALNYLTLAQAGYFGMGKGDSVFYPLYPALVSLVAPVMGSDYVAAGLFVTTLAAGVVFAMLYLLGEQAFGPDAARHAVLALAVYPTAFFLLAPFTESVFIALTLATFVAAGARRWWLTGLLGALASLARGPGILTAAAIAWIAWKQRPAWRGPAIRGVILPLPIMAGVILPAAGGAGFELWRVLAGYPALGTALSQYSLVQFVDPVRGLMFGLLEFVQVHDLATGLNLASALLFVAVLAAMIANPRWRRGEWLIYMALNLGLFLSKHSLMGSSLQSLGRYVLVLFPAFLVAGDWLSRRSQPVRFGYTVATSLGLIFLSVCYSLWWFIG